VVATAEHDPFRDEAVAYATWLRTAGMRKIERYEPGLTHNFLLLDRVSPACAGSRRPHCPRPGRCSAAGGGCVARCGLD
jgi:acetyl esterase/lipase